MRMLHYALVGHKSAGMEECRKVLTCGDEAAEKAAPGRQRR
jgi:hypothetical protein